MNIGKISVRYARALYALASEQGVEQQLFEQVQHLSEVFFKMPELSDALSNPLFGSDDKENSCSPPPARRLFRCSDSSSIL